MNAVGVDGVGRMSLSPSPAPASARKPSPSPAPELAPGASPDADANASFNKKLLLAAVLVLLLFAGLRYLQLRKSKGTPWSCLPFGFLVIWPFLRLARRSRSSALCVVFAPVCWCDATMSRLLYQIRRQRARARPLARVAVSARRARARGPDQGRARQAQN